MACNDSLSSGTEVASTWSAPASAAGGSAALRSLCPASWVAAGPLRRPRRLLDEGRFLAAFLPLGFAEDGTEAGSSTCARVSTSVFSEAESRTVQHRHAEGYPYAERRMMSTLFYAL